MIQQFLRLLRATVTCWALAVLVAFVLADPVPRWPRWLELPWSGFDDFAVTPAGEMLVYSSHFQQLLVYDLEGAFQISLPGVQGGGYHYLAVDVEGRVYVGSARALCEGGTLGANELSFHCRGGEGKRATGWRLNDAGVAEPVFTPVPAPNRAVRPGEMLMTFGSGGRKRFDLESGGWVKRRGDRLRVHRPRAEIVTIATPWYLYWLKFPFPGVLSWIVGFFMVWADSRRNDSARHRANESPKARLGSLARKTHQEAEKGLHS